MTPIIYNYKNPTGFGFIYIASDPDTDKQFDYFGETVQKFVDRTREYRKQKRNRKIVQKLKLYSKTHNVSKLKAFEAFQFQPFCSIWLPDDSNEDCDEVRFKLEEDLIKEYKTHKKYGGLNMLKKKAGHNKTNKNFSNPGWQWWNDGKKNYQIWSGESTKGLTKGMVERDSYFLETNFKWYNDGIKNIKIMPGDDTSGLKPGLIFANGSSPLKGRKRSKKAIQKGIEKRKGKVAYTDGKNFWLYYEGEQPEGLVRGGNPNMPKGRSTCSTLGRKAYTDEVRDYYLFEDDPKIKQLNLRKGGKARPERNAK